jgi:hypothetical protein
LNGRQQNFMKRGRNQRRRQGINVNRALDSNGPDVRIRGTASQIYEKYQALARDATSAGDRVKAENYLQHAEHYFRVLRAMQPVQSQPSDNAGEGDFEGDQPSMGEFPDRRPYAEGGQGEGGPDDGEVDARGYEPQADERHTRPNGGEAAGQPQRDNNRDFDPNRHGGNRRRHRPRRPHRESEAGSETPQDVEPTTV